MSEPYVCGPIVQPCRCADLREWQHEAVQLLVLLTTKRAASPDTYDQLLHLLDMAGRKDLADAYRTLGIC